MTTPSLRYLVLQIPGTLFVAFLAWALHDWLGVPLWAVLALVGASIAKDVLLYPWVRPSLVVDAAGSSAGLRPLVGEIALAESELAPSGWVRLGNELWRAELEAPSSGVPAGTQVRVRALRGLTLYVELVDRIRG